MVVAPMRSHRTRSLVAPLALVAGCTFDPGGTPGGDGGGGDGSAIDASLVDATCECPLGCEAGGASCAAFDPSNLEDFALLEGVTEALIVTAGNWVLDTDAGTLRDPGNAIVVEPSWTTLLGDTNSPDLQVMAVARLDVIPGATVRVIGHRALLVLSRGAIVIDGTIDVSAGCVTSATPGRDRVWCGGPGGGDGGHPNPGSNARVPADGCAPGGDGDASTTSAEHGGGGGGFGGLGADGGGVDGNGPDSEGGVACGTISLEPLRGGSGGGGAGYVRNATDDSRTSGGGGGGGLQLTSREAITVRGTIDAGGGGGAGTAQAGTFTPPGTDGGGGGGAGGGILLEAPTVTIEATAIVVANGGGGGAGIVVDRHGERGQRNRVRALGGLNDDASGGGFGATGDVDGEEATDGAAPGDGGSGGGGAVGRIHVHVSVGTFDVSAVISPVASEAPLFPL